MASSVERPLVAVVGGDTLLAREIRELLDESKPSPRVQLISAAADGSILLAAEEEETVIMTPLTAESLEGAKVAFLAGSAASSRRTLKIVPGGTPVLIDLSGALDEQPQARLRAPSVESHEDADRSGPIQVIAHPAAIAMAAFLPQLARAGTLRRSIVHIFEPASERGQKGLDELQQQTVAVLSFQKLKMDVFDAQLGFSLLARYGEEALEPLEGVEQRVEKHLASLLASQPGVPMPSLRLIQAPVFHGHSFSVWAEFEDYPDGERISQVLSEGGLDVRPEDPPSNTEIAGQSGLSVGAISVDRNNAHACWCWVVTDNLRLAAENGIRVAREIL